MSRIQISHAIWVVSVFTAVLLCSCTDPYQSLPGYGDVVIWEKTFGGTLNDKAIMVRQTSDGGYIVTGITTSFGAGNMDIFLLKLLPNGDMSWMRTFGGSDEDQVRCIQNTDDGGYILCGYTKSFGAGDYDLYLLKTDVNGNEQWSKTYGGEPVDEGCHVLSIPEGGYLVAGYTKSWGHGNTDMWLLKTDAVGDTIWSRTYGGRNFDRCASVKFVSDGGYILAGRTLSFGAGEYDVYVVRTDAEGDTIWTKTYGGSKDDNAYDIIETTDGCFIILGVTYSFGMGNTDIYMLKIDAEGGLIWSRTYGGYEYERGYTVLENSEGGYVIMGRTQSFGRGKYDFYLLKTDAEGNGLWGATFGGDQVDKGFSIDYTDDGGYILCGYTESFGAGGADGYIIKTGILP